MAKKPATSTALVPWDEQLARDAEIAAELERNAGGSAFFSVKGGILAFNDAPVPGNKMGVIIVDGIFENIFYSEDFNPDVATPPTCFAFARDEADLAPHETVVAAGQAQNEECKGCPMNEWGTADRGRGKACRNTRRLALLPGGTFNEQNGRFSAFTDAEHFEKAPIGFLKLPVTSVKGYASFVKTVAGALKRPPHGIFTTITVVPDAKTQFKVTVEPIAKVPDALMAAVMQRREEAKATIEQPYPLSFDNDDAPAGRGRPTAKGVKAKAAPPAKSARPPVKGAAKKPARY